MKPKSNLSCIAAFFLLFLGFLPSLLAQGSVDQSSQTATAAPPGGADPSTYSYQADLFTGRFSYGVPIVTAPGRQGAQPHLTLGYSSSGGNGWCGVGWALDAGYIQRDTRRGVPIAWGPTDLLPSYNVDPVLIPLTRYDDSKGFISSFGNANNTLVEIGPTNQNPIVYRQQVDTSFLTYEYFTNNYWEVIDKSGCIFYFGESTNSQMENSKTNWPQGVGSSTWRWALDRVVDANGNETFLNYTVDSGALYLTNIIYNANTNALALAGSDEVDFLLTNRTDTNLSYISGYRVTSQKLLSEIDVKAGGQNVRKYVLGYAQSPSTLRSLLTSVTQYGSDYATALPALTFAYQVESFTFSPETNWFGVNSQGDTGSAWNAIRSSDSSYNRYLDLIDIDGDGLPDRVMRKYNSPYVSFVAQRNTGYGFVTNNEPWGPIDGGGNITQVYPFEAGSGVGTAAYVSLIDLNGDGYPDIFVGNLNGTAPSWQPGTGIMGSFASYPNTNSLPNWANFNGSGSLNPPYLCAVDCYFAASSGEYNTGGYNVCLDTMLDMNGDGLPDSVNASLVFNADGAITNWLVQLNNGPSQTSSPATNLWTGAQSEGNPPLGWGMPSSIGEDNNTLTMLADINGDGLPDRILIGESRTNFEVQFNNGAGFEPPVSWGPLDLQGAPTVTWGSPIGYDGSGTCSALVDMTGDGLLARVMRSVSLPYTNWLVQLNTGSGFGTPINMGPVASQSEISEAWNDLSANNGDNTYVDLMDLNGDGLPDRIMEPTNAPYDHFVVQLNQGPFPDLLNVISNGMGGSVQISYAASTTLNNRSKDWTNDPWAEGAKSLLPFNVWVVSQIAASGGMGNNSTNSYAFKGGYYNAPEREFRGFSQCIMTDPLGAKTTTYFHQSGGRDNSALGEYMDQSSESKKGIPFRIDLIGNDGRTNKITLNKVQEIELNSNGWYFPYVAQTTVLDYEGQSGYRATAVQYTYNTNTENLIAEADLGEVANVAFNGQTFTTVGNNAVFKWITYTNIGNILNRPTDVKVTSDSGGAIRLRETINIYDSKGNLKTGQSWLNTSNNFITTIQNSYDQYGNLYQTTDAAGISTTTTYDSTFEQFPISQTTGPYTSYSIFDNRSGELLTSTDIKGLVSSNTYDVFFRGTASFISTNANGSPVLWQTRTSYSLAGIHSEVSSNYVESQVNDAVDPVNGFVTYTYSDGMGRTIETRAESETANQYRVANTVYDPRGNPVFDTLPYFSSGSGYTIPNATYLGSLTAYDSIGRANQSTPAINGAFSFGILTNALATQGDVGSPVAPTTTAFSDGGNPWATVVTDPNGKVTKSYRDAFGRSVTNTQVTVNGNVNTVFGYDLLGNLTNTMDNAGNSTLMVYDSLGRKIGMTDPDMGVWTYVYDNDSRLVQQTDAKNNTIQFSYSDPLGRLTSKQIYNSANALVGMVTYTYDSSGGDANYAVFPGQLYKVTDLQGYERFSYDVRGRTLKDSRFLSVNAMEYVTQASYDDADRIQQLTYPQGKAVIQYSYDLAGHLIQVQSSAGTPTNEVFYTPQSFNALDQLTGCRYGNGVSASYSYYTNSGRLQNISSGTNGANFQNLTYKYDDGSDVTNVNDGVNPSGAASASISATYDDLYRVTSVNSAARGMKSYGYNSIGNILTNQDVGTSAYQYGAQPHMVTSANGVGYGYDACGNMTNRGNQTLTYDAQNQLIQVATTNDTVRFGYDDSGERLWRAGTNGYTVWIGGIYEINNGKVLCHVIAGGQLIATFEPECNAGLAKVFGQKNWYTASTTAGTLISWPFKNGRGRWTLFGGTWLAILGICVTAGRSVQTNRPRSRFKESLTFLQRLAPVAGRRLSNYKITPPCFSLSQREKGKVRESAGNYPWANSVGLISIFGRQGLHFNCLWKQAITLTSISAILLSGIGNADAAPAYTPVFDFYSTDYLGSSNVLTDNSGNLVQHYEYTTFGQTAYQNNSSAFPVSDRYTGQIADDETGLYYYGARYYDPQLGRFIQPDPEIPDPTDSQSFNHYSYCRNNPLNATDPSGLFDFPSFTGWTIDEPLPNPYGNDLSPVLPDQSISQQIWGPLQQFGDSISEGLGNIESGLSTAWGDIEGSLSPAASWFAQNLEGQLQATRSLIEGGIQNGIQSAVNPGSQFINPAIGAYNTLSELASNPRVFVSTQHNGFMKSLQTPQGIGQDQVNFGIFFGTLFLGGEGALEEGAEGASSGIFNRGGRFADLDAARLDGEVGHHIAQNAYNRMIGVSRADGPAIGMTIEDHMLTRTFAGRGRLAMAKDAKLNARRRMAKDIRDLRAFFGTKYNQGALEAIDYAKTLPEYAK